MIVFDLFCAAGHRFEAWFRDGSAFEEQRLASSIRCPVCADANVVKAPTAMHVAGMRRAEGDGHGDDDGAAAASLPVAPPSMPAEMRQALQQLREHVEKSCDYVGQRFAEEARSIHYGEKKNARNIYGEASADEAAALRDEGISVQPLPWRTRRDG